MFAVRRRLRVLSATRLPLRQVHSSAAAGDLRRRQTKRYEVEDLDFDIDLLPEFEDDDATSAAHLMIQQQKQILHYLRLIERDAPRLKGPLFCSDRCQKYLIFVHLAIRKSFVPPPDSLPLVVRSISYSGEDHPATKKRVIVAAVSQLPLQSPQALHKLKLLAGTRWSDKPPRDSGIGIEEDKRIGKHGYIKLSCEDFPEPAMNLKWGSDILDNLLKEANVCSSHVYSCIATDECCIRTPKIPLQTFLWISDISTRKRENIARANTSAADLVPVQPSRTFPNIGYLHFRTSKPHYNQHSMMIY